MKPSKKKKIVAAVIASFAGISGTSIMSSVIAYDAIFPRYERPNYALTPGQYCIERVEGLTREEIWIESDDNNLKAYIYRPSTSSKGVIVFGHGMRSGADDYLPIIDYMVKKGYTVVAHNVAGTFESDGESTVGMCQSLVDMDNVMSFVQSRAEFRNKPLFTMGHSWGGYAATSVLSLKKGVRACAVIAALRNASTMMSEKGEQYVGKIAKATTPILQLYQKLLFGKYVNYDAISGINASGIPILVAHGVDDKTITFDTQSIYAYRKEITNPNVEFYIGKGLQGDHTNIWHSKESAIYQLEVESELKLLKANKGDDLTEQEKIDFYKTVDHELYSQVNFELMDKIVKLFDSQL